MQEQKCRKGEDFPLLFFPVILLFRYLHTASDVVLVLFIDCDFIFHSVIPVDLRPNMEIDPDWCSADESEEKETELSSSSHDSGQGSDQDSDQDSAREIQLNEVDGCQQSELVHSQLPFERPERNGKRRMWKRDIPFSKSHHTKTVSQQSLGKTSHSYPVPSLRREDARLFNSQHSSPFSTSSRTARPSPIPKFTLSNLRSTIHSKTNSSFLTHRLPLPQRLSSLPLLKTGSSSSTSSSAPPETPSSLPSAFRSCSKSPQEGGTARAKKQVLLKLENNVIVQPSSSYKEPRPIDTSAIFAPRPPPLHDDSCLNMPPKTEPKVYSSSDSAKYDSPPASLLAEVAALPDTRSASPDSRTDFPPKITKEESGSVAAEAVDLKAGKGKDANPPPKEAPKNTPFPPQTRGRNTHLLNLKAGDKRGSSSSLASETPALKHSKSSTSTEGVFFFDEDIERYQGSGPDDNNEVCPGPAPR